MTSANTGRVARRPCVLLVEDDADTLEQWELALREAGFRVRTAESCAAGLAALGDAETIDVIVCDYWLRDGTGEQLLREATRLGLPVARRALLCTAHASVSTSSYASVLHKPIEPEDLVARVRELLPANPSAAASNGNG